MLTREETDLQATLILVLYRWVIVLKKEGSHSERSREEECMRKVQRKKMRRSTLPKKREGKEQLSAKKWIVPSFVS